MLSTKLSIKQLFETILVVLCVVQLIAGYYNFVHKTQTLEIVKNPIASPMIILVLKELLLLSLTCLSFIYFLKKIRVKIMISIILLVVSFSLFASLTSLNLIQTYSIVRFLCAFVVFGMLVNMKYEPSKIIIIFIFFILSIQVGFQIWQLFNWHFYVVMVGVIPLRFPGILSTPTGAGCFAFAVYLLWSHRLFPRLVALSSIVLSASFSVFAAVVIYHIIKSSKKLSLLLAPVGVIGIYFVLEAMRPGVFRESLGPRLEIFLSLLDPMSLLPFSAGKASLGYEMLSGIDPISADGMLSQVVINFGLYSIPLFGWYVFVYLHQVYKIRNFYSFGGVIALVPIIVTAPIPEIYPTVFILIIAFLELDRNHSEVH